MLFDFFGGAGRRVKDGASERVDIRRDVQQNITYLITYKIELYRVKCHCILFSVSNGPNSNIQHKIKQRKANWIDYILCGNCLLKHAIEEMLKWSGIISRSSYYICLRKRETTGT
jgi:hypothetical protein